MQKIKKFLKEPMNVLLTVVFVLVLILNFLVVTTSDDLGYQINNGLIDIFKREYVQYMTWTGRSVAHIIARIFLAMPKIIFDICNSICFVYFTYLIYVHVTGSKKKDKPFLYSLIVLMVFLFEPLFGQTVLWETGSCNYLWTTTIVLSFLLPYRLETKCNPILMFLIGIIAGWTNENTGGALVLMILLILGYRFYKKEKNSTWMYTGLIGSVVGFLVMVLAPGNKVRAADFTSTNGKVYDLIHDFNDFLNVLENGQLAVLILAFICIGLAIAYKKEKKEITYSIFYTLCGIAAVFAIILSPVQVLFDRSMFGATTLIIIGVGTTLKLIMKDKIIKEASICLLSTLLFFTCINYARTLPDLLYTRYQYMKRETYVEKEKANGNYNPTIYTLNSEFETSYNPYYGLGDVSAYRLLWINKYYAETHGLESVQATTLDKWNTIYSNGDSYLMNITDFDTYIDALQDDKYVVCITSSYLDSSLYSEYESGLKKLGFNSLKSYMTGIYQNSSLQESNTSSEEGQYLESSINGHYVYMSSSSDESYSDILVDNVEYTNDRPGITFVVFDTEKDKVVDSITWTYDTDQGGTRYYLEK